MSHPPSSQEETCKPARSEDGRQNNVLMFPFEKVRAARAIQSELAQRANATVKSAATKPLFDVGAIKTGHLTNVVKDIKSGLYAGPCVIASITGVTVSQAADAIRQVRHGARWLDFSYTPPITTVMDVEIEHALRLLGYVGEWHYPHDRPTLATYLSGRAGLECNHPCVVSFGTHCVAVSGGLLCDVRNRGVVIDIDDAEGFYKKVKRVLVLTKRIAPSTIASKTPAPTTGADAKVDQLFRKAIKAETNAMRIKLTPHEVFIIHPSKEGWYWLGSRENVEDQILMPRPNNRLAGNSPAAAAYRAAMGY